MGGTTFYVFESGKTPEQAFDRAKSNAFFMHGHSGYTGTIAEKSSFVVIPNPEQEAPEKLAHRLIRDDDPRVADKWGDAGCIEIGPDPQNKNLTRFLFFGWASC